MKARLLNTAGFLYQYRWIITTGITLALVLTAGSAFGFDKITE